MSVAVLVQSGNTVFACDVCGHEVRFSGVASPSYVREVAELHTASCGQPCGARVRGFMCVAPLGHSEGAHYFRRAS